MLLANFDSYDLCSMEQFGKSGMKDSIDTEISYETKSTESRVVGLQSMFKMHRIELTNPVAFN